MFALVCATVFCSKGYFQSKNCMIELRAAVVAQKPLIALLDPDASRGGLSAVEVRQQLAEATAKYTMWGFTSKPSGEDLNDALFANEPIEWNRLGAFQDVTLRLIAERLLPERRCATYVHGELLSHPMPTLPPPRAGRRFHAYCDVHNVGAAALLREVATELAWDIRVSSERFELHQCECMLVYLTSQVSPLPISTPSMLRPCCCSVLSPSPRVVADVDEWRRQRANRVSGARCDGAERALVAGPRDDRHRRTGRTPEL